MFYKKNLFVAALTFTVFLIALFTNAQTIIVVLKQPPPNQWHVEDLWQLTLTNTSQEPYNVYLYGTVEEADAGIIFEGTSATFELLPNYSGPVNPGDLEPVDVGYVNDDYEDIVQRTGTLSAGTYTICVYIKSVDGEVMGYDCKMQIIAHPSQPELINPVDEANVTEELPVFLWLPPMPMLEFVTYNIKIVELLDGQTPIEATEANPTWFKEAEILSTSFQYPISARPFEAGISYAWQVTAISDDGFMIGESQVWSFTYGTAVVVISEEFWVLELISPSNDEKIDPSSTSFDWKINEISPITTFTDETQLSYTIKIWLLPAFLIEMMHEYGIIENEEDYQSIFTDPVKKYLLFEKKGIKETSFRFSAEMYNLFIPGSAYVWQVIAYKGDSLIGSSEEFPMFTISEDYKAFEDEFPSLDSPLEDSITQTGCKELKTTKLTLEWQDEVKKSTGSNYDTLTNITQSLSISIKPLSCKPKIDNEFRQVSNSILDVPPDFKDNSPKDDNIYYSFNHAIYAGNCTYILSYTIYSDADFKKEIKKMFSKRKKKKLKILSKNLKLVYGAMFIPAIAPWKKDDSLPDFGRSKKYLEVVPKIYSMDNVKKSIKKLKQEHPDTWTVKWLESIFYVIELGKFGYVTTLWEICGYYQPCFSCSYAVASYSISSLGSQDQYIKRKWSLGNKSGTHENKGKNY